MNDILYPGSVLHTVNHNTYEYYIAPSNFKHGCIYFGKGLKTFLDNSILKHINTSNINDEYEYVINCDGKQTKPEILSIFLKNRNEVRIYNFYNDNVLRKDVMYYASRYSCKYIGTAFSFRNRGKYCFQIIVESFKAAMLKYNLNNLYFNIIIIGGKQFYNSKSISNHINFYLVYKQNNEKKKIYYDNNCIIKL
ncbi:ORF MSV039 putative Molluscum contagiosum MCV062 homolog (vaccinia G6R), similar to GB:U60315 [Melanoplus sanguinipes entomopoxvirus]|uniref:ORF MSV039 putative Molluscum contagiosum MCV062 homolog (Vaccinia G6R), similar to GB:U60315 n=1 Tax=Melanoplus sanguinipes entomopoxvirus TaxID=83191 RepID=Q9YW53_MSEPV|nr:ORF MSV039 putative Molluscum contagiosum MCV062 homolog (vaccinia G6R), similar to GB:U60315 [Melanoplus sanguinipes entomopoxvirus]AAC97835.1 ORF MSV039 putative Molluscum contagiosum MCV062 homolog (vaccinia G6R), similar to GB:U60315 [Melanoplus sanguinipes entomopoxvirus 'O']